MLRWTASTVDVSAWGISADNGTTDNSTRMAEIIDDAPRGTELFLPPVPEGRWYGFGSTVEIDKPISLAGKWNRMASSTPFGSVCRPTDSTAQASMDGVFSVRAPYVNIEGLAFRGHSTSNGGGLHWGYSSHMGRAKRVFSSEFLSGFVLGDGSDHITHSDSHATGNYYGALFDTGNLFDFAFIDCGLDGNSRSSMHLVADQSAVNVTAVRTHLGFGQYGITQAATSNGAGFAGLTLLDSPIEQVTVQHINIVNGGHIDVRGGYWVWTGTPAQSAFKITNVNSGPIFFSPRLEPLFPNGNAPAVIEITGYLAHMLDFRSALNGFAQTKYISPGLQRLVFIDGVPAGGTAAPVAGTWERGDVLRNTAPSAGGPPGWVCTTAGTPGTWKAMANLAA